MEDIVFRSIVGMGGFFATVSLTPVNELLGFCVGVATLVYMTASAIKVIKELRK